MIDAVLFDVGGVLIGPRAVTVTRLLWELAAVRVPPRIAARSFAVADRAALEGGVAMADGRGWARHWARALFVPEEVGEDVHRRIDGSPELTSRVWSDVNPQAAPALARLRRSGLRVGLVSQSDGHLESRLRAAGLAEPVDAFVDSGLVPWNKPDPEIYRYAAGLVGVPLERCAFLSDVMTDVRGAARAGCRHVSLYDPHGVWTDTVGSRMTSLLSFAEHCRALARPGTPELVHQP